MRNKPDLWLSLHSTTASSQGARLCLEDVWENPGDLELSSGLIGLAAGKF
jgi:hypothetical protein